MSKGPGKVPRPRLVCSVQRSAFQASIQWHCFESVMTSEQSLPAALAGIATMEIGGQNGQFADGCCRTVLGMKLKQLTQKQTISVRCPTCDVAAGKPCVLQAGGLRFGSHPNRKLFAAETVEKKRIQK